MKSIHWISVEAKEAEVEIADGHYACLAFSQPCGVNVDDEVSMPLHVFDIKNAMLSKETELGVWKTSESGHGRRVVARLVDVERQLLAVGGIQLVVDKHLPGGLEAEKVIEFECARLDLW
ncbi:hypothetical protein [Noviherbaspirillum pedocola]|uniref:Uncharacterized protein n=1 Tax=Noviherbaspirillum pedocola TaxID=2801341 RepID=A0A934T2K7_9BURK|nr:hypothetical protein [Noviherbaspirillum pedocola]MBK4738029.1 hypothetical protein [Noviherbaspirillum pedocola]